MSAQTPQMVPDLFGRKFNEIKWLGNLDSNQD